MAGATKEFPQSPKTITACGLCQQDGINMPTCSPELKTPRKIRKKPQSTDTHFTLCWSRMERESIKNASAKQIWLEDKASSARMRLFLGCGTTTEKVKKSLDKKSDLVMVIIEQKLTYNYNPEVK